MPRLTLIGYRGTGKSTVARLLARRLGCPWCDADEVLEAKLGRSIASLVEDRGENAFRDEEAAVLVDLARSFSGVLATGGGAVLRPANRALLAAAGRPIVWLTATPDTVRRRLAADPTTQQRRPSLTAPGVGDPLAEVAAVLEQREPLYRSLADHVVDTSALEPEDVVTEIVSWWGKSAAIGDEDGRSRDSGGSAT